MFVSVEFDQSEGKIMEDIIGKKDYLFVTRSTLEELTVLYGNKCPVCNGSVNCIPEKYKNTIFVGYSSRTRDAAINMLLDLVESASVTIRSARTVVEFLKKMNVVCGDCDGVTKNQDVCESQSVDLLPLVDPSSPETVPSIGREETLASQGEIMETEENRIETVSVFSDVETNTASVEVKQEVMDPEEETASRSAPTTSRSSSRRSSRNTRFQGNVKREETTPYDEYMEQLNEVAVAVNPFLAPAPPARTSSLASVENARALRGSTVTSTSSNSSAATPRVPMKVESIDPEDYMKQLEEFVGGEDYQCSISSDEGERMIEIEEEQPMEMQEMEENTQEPEASNAQPSSPQQVAVAVPVVSKEQKPMKVEQLVKAVVVPPPIKVEKAFYVHDPNNFAEIPEESLFDFGYNTVDSTPAQAPVTRYSPQPQYNTMVPQSLPQSVQQVQQPKAEPIVAPVRNVSPVVKVQPSPLPVPSSPSTSSLVQRVAPVQRPTPAFAPYGNVKKLPVQKQSGKKVDKIVRMSCKECERPIKAADGLDLQARINFSIISHVRIHMDTMPFNCDLCAFKARHPAGIRHHIEKEHPQHPRNYFTDKSNDAGYIEETRAKARKCFPEWDIKI